MLTLVTALVVCICPASTAGLRSLELRLHGEPGGGSCLPTELTHLVLYQMALGGNACLLGNLGITNLAQLRLLKVRFYLLVNCLYLQPSGGHERSAV